MSIRIFVLLALVAGAASVAGTIEENGTAVAYSAESSPSWQGFRVVVPTSLWAE